MKDIKIMKYIFAIAFALMLAACNQDAPAPAIATVVGTSAPQGTYASDTGRTTYTFNNGRVRVENPTLGVSETTFQMDGDVAKFQFDGGMPVGLKKVNEGVWVHTSTGGKFVKN